MPLTPGQTLSHYEILGPLGAGGMGEVYRARDTRLEREVAIKVLPEALGQDEERLQRFEREAKVLASLNHPNVAGIHGVDRQDEVYFLALELVPGEDLETRLKRGALRLEEAVDVCRQIAEGLEAAHEAGVVHRDLKPANVRITPEGVVKVLDFGLAKPMRSKGSGPAAAGAESDSALLTEAGLVLGTPTYMSPEQARGKPVDRRTDLWALGCVLYRCLSGKQAFGGPSVADVLAAIVEREPDWTALPAATPPGVRELVRRCLAKDPRRRLRDAGDARLELERALEERAWTRRPEAGPASRSSRVSPALVGVLGAALGAALLWGMTRTTRAPRRELRLSIDMHVPYQETFPRIAPDGSAVVHEGRLPAEAGKEAVRALFRRDLDDFESRLIAGTENPVSYCFSPDGEQLAVLVELSGRGGELTLMRVPLRGDAPSTRLDAWPRRARRESGIAWLRGDLIVGSADPDHLIVYSLADSAVRVQKLERAFEHPGQAVDVVRRLDDGRHVLGSTFYYGERGYQPAVVAVDIETARETIVSRDGEFGAVHSGNRLLFTRGDTLFEAPFDAARLQASGPPVPLADGLRTTNAWHAAWFDVAQDGTLIWLPGGRRGTQNYLAVLERDGELTPFWPERMLHDGSIAVSADGSFALSLLVSGDGRRCELWGTATGRPQLRPILAAPGTDFLNGVLLPDGRELIYQRSSKDGQQGIFRAPVETPEQAVLLIPSEAGASGHSPVAISPDGQLLVVGLEDAQGVQYSTLSLDHPDVERLQPLVRLGRDSFWPKFSLDGRWLAYMPDEADRTVLMTQRFENGSLTGPKVRVPTVGDEMPWDFTWSRDPDRNLNEFVLVANDRHSLFSVAFEDEPTGSFGAPRPITNLEEAYVLDIVSLADGRCLLVLQDPEEQEMDRIGVVIGALSGD